MQPAERLAADGALWRMKADVVICEFDPTGPCLNCYVPVDDFDLEDYLDELQEVFASVQRRTKRSSWPPSSASSSGC